MMEQLERPVRTSDLRAPRRKRSRWLVALTAVAGAGVVTVATAGAYVVAHSGNEPLPAGSHQVEIYTVDDAISTVVPAAERPGVIGRFIGLCDADTHYIEVDGAGLCVVLNGSLGTVRATGADHGVELAADQAARVRDIVHASDQGSPEPSTRVLLAHDGGWAGLVAVADLDAGGPVTGKIVG